MRSKKTQGKKIIWEKMVSSSMWVDDPTWVEEPSRVKIPDHKYRGRHLVSSNSKVAFNRSPRFSYVVRFLKSALPTCKRFQFRESEMNICLVEGLQSLDKNDLTSKLFWGLDSFWGDYILSGKKEKKLKESSHCTLAESVSLPNIIFLQ